MEEKDSQQVQNTQQTDTKDNAQTSDFEFLQEKIKERPIDKKKLLKRTLITASMALLFGLIACLTFLVIEPVLNNWIYPEEEPEVVTFPQEENEMLPEDMLTENTEGASNNYGNRYESHQEEIDQAQLPYEQIEAGADDVPDEEENIQEQTENVEIARYEQLHTELLQAYKEISTSMVTVTGVKSDVDWFNNTYESEGQVAGVIIANNTRELLIMTQKTPLDAAERILVTFCNQTSVDGVIKGYDVNTNLTVIAVELKNLDAAVLDAITVSSFGSSMSSDVVCYPVIAVGNIQGYKDNVCYGMITSTNNVVTLPDSQYKMMTTDIYGSQTPSGILVNMKGQVIGVIDNAYNHTDTKNLVSAIGITELKGLITKISNGYVPAYVGIYTQDISAKVRREQNLPQGAYISDIDMDSPAMLKGIQKGDIVIQVNDKVIDTASDYMNAVRACTVEQEIDIVILRASHDDYEQMTFRVTTQNNQ